MPRVSILMPCRDAATTLPAAIESIRSQTFPDFEVVVDDGSGDDRFAHLFTWAQRDGRVRVLQGNRRGPVPALATALAAARGDLVANMDPAGVADHTRIEKQVALVERDAGLAGCGTGVRAPAHGDPADPDRPYGEWLNSLGNHAAVARDVFVDCPLAHPTLLMRRHVLLGVGGYRETGWPEDYDLVLRVWAAGYRLTNVPEILYQGPLRPRRSDALATPDHLHGAQRRLDLKVHFLRRTLLTGGREAVIWGTGPAGTMLALELARAGTGVAAFVDPDGPGAGETRHGVPVIPPHGLAELAGAASLRQALVLVAADDRAGREGGREACRRLGLVDGEDLMAVA
jgi:hypothetical protein